MESKYGARQVVGCAAVVTVNHAGIHGDAGSAASGDRVSQVEVASRQVDSFF